MLRALLLATVAAIAMPAHAQVYKCTEGGQTVYKDRPCVPTDRNAGKIEVRGGTLSSPEDLEREAFRTKIMTAVANRRVFVGMPASDARRSWGNPTKINRDIYGSGAKEQWIYERRGGTQYIYVEDGRVTALQGGR